MKKPYGRRIALIVTNIPSTPGSTAMYEDRYYDNSDRLVKVVRHKHLRKLMK